MRSIYQRCRAELSDLELWPGYFSTRFHELLSVHSHWPNPRVGRLLEIGCGMGYVSALLSTAADEVYATDIAEEDDAKHAVGLRRTEAFLERLSVRGVTTKSVNAERISFEDDSFDMVFSMFVVQHIPDRRGAAAEMARVLKPGGVAVHLVPSRTKLVYACFRYWVYLAERSVIHALRLVRGLMRGPRKGPNDDVSSDQRSARETIDGSGQFQNFPLPPTFGMYESSRQEWVESGLSEWQELFGAGGQLKAVKAATIKLNPVPLLVEVLVPTLAVKLFPLFRRIDGVLGQWPILRHLGTNYLIVLEKPRVEGGSPRR